MDNLSLHITDITANSVRTKAPDIEIDTQIKDTSACTHIADNGYGMDPETALLVRNPFYTARTTRKMDPDLPLLIQDTEQTDGSVEVSSIQGKGTTVITCSTSSHTGCLPLGDLADTIAMLISSNSDINIHLSYHSDLVSFNINMRESKGILENMLLSHPKVMFHLRELIAN